jgi:hypothetical protein
MAPGWISGAMPTSSGARMSSRCWGPVRRWCSAQPRSAPTTMPVGMMIPKVPVKVKVESGPASAIMKPRKLAA